VLAAIARRRSLVIAIGLVVALAGVVGPTIATGLHGSCVEEGQAHCVLALAPTPSVERHEQAANAESFEPRHIPPIFVRPLLKIPLAG
jgi:hypothetical protein